MRFLERIKEFDDIYDSDHCGVKDRAKLYGLCKETPPLARHIVFFPMPQNITDAMVDNYINKFPEDLLKIYSHMNGADLFWTVDFLGKDKIRIATSRFDLYGIPLTSNRMHIEPYNISIEDSERQKSTPKSWLKFGSYYTPEDMVNRLDLFVDTQTLIVYAVKHNDVNCCAVKAWRCIDECLCDIFDLLKFNLGMAPP